MAKLIANTPCAGLLPKTIGAITLSEVDAGPVTLVAPFSGGVKTTSAALKAAIGVGFPAPNRVVGGDVRALWCGLDQAFIMGARCPDLSQAACVDHSDAWAIVRVDGVAAGEVLARLVPVDLRRSVFKRGHTARTLIGHMTGSVTRIGATTFDVMVMRSMASTLVHELEQAAANITARAMLT